MPAKEYEQLQAQIDERIDLVWILVLNPPSERPIAWSSPAFLGTSTTALV